MTENLLSLKREPLLVLTSISGFKICQNYCARFFFSSNHNNQFVIPVNLTRKKYVSKANLQKIAFVDVGRWSTQKWKAKNGSRPLVRANLLRGIENKTVRRWKLLLKLFKSGRTQNSCQYPIINYLGHYTAVTHLAHLILPRIKIYVVSISQFNFICLVVRVF